MLGVKVVYIAISYNMGKRDLPDIYTRAANLQAPETLRLFLHARFIALYLQVARIQLRGAHW